jgi:hypothetical protein
LVTRRLDIPEDSRDTFDFFVSLNAQEVRFALEALCKIPLHEIDLAGAVSQMGVAIETMQKIVAKLVSSDVVEKHYEDEKVIVADVFAEEGRPCARRMMLSAMPPNELRANAGCTTRMAALRSHSRSRK